MPEAVRRHVVRRGRLLLIWWVTEWLFAAAVFAFLLHRTITQADPIERAFMGVLAAMTVALLGFDGGVLKDAVDVPLWIRSANGAYGAVESVHLILCHALVTCLNHADEMAAIHKLARPNGRIVSPGGLAPDWDKAA